MEPCGHRITVGPGMEGVQVPEVETGWIELMPDRYQRYLWQVVEICLREKIDVVFEDDEKVIDLFRRFGPPEDPGAADPSAVPDP